MDKFDAMKKVLGGDKEAKEILQSLDPSIWEDKPYESYRHDIRNIDNKTWVTIENSHPFF